jgi:23S rRNA (adenine2503-C2)-methyltransferase
MSVDILGLGSEELGAMARGLLPSGAGAFSSIYARAFAEGRLSVEGLGLSARSAEAWGAAFHVGLLRLVGSVAEGGPFGETEKAVFEASDGSRLECVRIPMPARADRIRSTICVSSQVGCRGGCTFCETGRMGFVRDLDAAEIVSQVLSARVVLGWDCGNVVFMGMGEPLDNIAQLGRAILVLADRRGFGLSYERMTVCTSGPPGGIEALRSLGLKRLNLSISLNAASDELRSRLMPVNRGVGLARLAASLAAYPSRANFVLGVNYCLLPGINDSREDARLVASFCRVAGRSLVNLIPYNPGSSALSRPPTEEEADRFASYLREEGCETRRRATRGLSIMAACGQLGGPFTRR